MARVLIVDFVFGRNVIRQDLKVSTNYHALQKGRQELLSVALVDSIFQHSFNKSGDHG